MSGTSGSLGYAIRPATTVPLDILFDFLLGLLEMKNALTGDECDDKRKMFHNMN